MNITLAKLSHFITTIELILQNDIFNNKDKNISIPENKIY